MYLSCPHCDYEGPLDDPKLIGQAVDCPLCEQSIVVLEPAGAAGPTRCAGAGAAGSTRRADGRPVGVN